MLKKLNLIMIFLAAALASFGAFAQLGGAPKWHLELTIKNQSGDYGEKGVTLRYKGVKNCSTYGIANFKPGYAPSNASPVAPRQTKMIQQRMDRQYGTFGSMCFNVQYSVKNKGKSYICGITLQNQINSNDKTHQNYSGYLDSSSNICCHQFLRFDRVSRGYEVTVGYVSCGPALLRKK